MMTVTNEKLSSFCAENGVRFGPEIQMRDYTTFRIGGPAAAAFPENADALGRLLAFCNNEGIPYFIVGNGSNLLVSDAGTKKLLIFTSGLKSRGLWGESGIWSESGLLIPHLAVFARASGLSGLEFASGIPGSVGGGVCMNCGAYDGDMSKVVEKAEYLTKDGHVSVIHNDALEFRYRGSYFSDKPELCITRVFFRLTPADKEEIQAKMDDFAGRRKEKQPLNLPNAGSVFKRPKGYFVGKLIQDSGLRGVSIGGAQVSEKHAGFIVNTGGATCDDVLRLIAHIQEQVYKNFQVHLEREITYLD